MIKMPATGRRNSRWAASGGAFGGRKTAGGGGSAYLL